MADNSVSADAMERRPRRKIFDWITYPELVTLTPFQQFIRDIDWEKSPVGPMNQWPSQLREMVLLVVADPGPAVVYWGDKNTIIYNEAYPQLVGNKHPALQGQDPSKEFAEIWDYFHELLSTLRETAETVVEENAFLLLNRHGFLEETYFSWKFVPIIGPEGWVVSSISQTILPNRDD